MPIYRNVSRHNYGNYLGHPYSVGGIGSSGSNAVTVPAPPTQQASQQSVIMGHQSPAQALQTKIRSILTQDEVDMFVAMTERVKAAMTDEEVGVLQGAVGDMLGGNLVGTTQGLAMPGRIEYVQDDYSEYGADVPIEGIQPGYNCLDPDMATRIVVNWLDHGDETIQDLNALNNPADLTYEQRKNFEITGGGVDYITMTDKKVTMVKSTKLRPHLSIRRLYLVDSDVPSCGGFAKEVAPNVNAMLAGCTLREPDSYLISDGLVEIEVNKLMIAEHRKPPVLTQQSLAVPSMGASQNYGNMPNRSRRYGERGLIADVLAPPADEIQGPSYDDILNERDKRLHDERLVQEGAIELSESGRSASKLTPKGTRMTVRFPKSRANPLTGVPDPAPRALLLQEGIRALRQVDDDTADDLVQNHNYVGVQLELTEFDPALVPPGVDAAALVIEQGSTPLLPSAPAVPLSPAQLAQSMPGSTVTAGGISGTYTSAGYVGVSAWSNGMQVAANPIFQQVDEDGDEIPSIRIRNLRPGFVYRGQDGSEIEVDATGNYVIHDEQAQITYRATRMRDFNRFVNGSDLVGEFIEALGKLGANQEQAAGANLEMFIRWLVHKAAEHDKEEPPQDVPMVTPADVPAVSAGEMAPPILIGERSVELVLN